MTQPSAHHLLRLISRLERLEALPRTGWIPCGIQSPESIASHSYMVCVIALWLADTLQLQDPEQWTIDVASLSRIALLHDSAEAMLTDLPLPVKRFLHKSSVDQAESQAASLILEDSPPSWPQAHSLYQARGCLESKLVKAADQIQMLAKACQYASQQRGDVSRFFQNLDHLQDFEIPLVRETFDLLIQHHQQDTWYPCDFD